jgi:hypothetical protein
LEIGYHNVVNPWSEDAVRIGVTQLIGAQMVV